MHGYQEITCNFIFDVKMDFTWKSIFMANGSKTEAPVALTYSRFVSRDSVRLSLFIAALNYLGVMSCDIGNTYLNASRKETICFKSGEEFGGHQVKVMILVRSLYGIKTLGASWRSMFKELI